MYFDGIVVPVEVFIMVLFFKLEVVLLLLYSDDFVTFSSKTDIFYDRDTVVSCLILFVCLDCMFILFLQVKYCKLMTSKKCSEDYLPPRSNSMEELLSDHVTSLETTVLLITRVELWHRANMAAVVLSTLDLFTDIIDNTCRGGSSHTTCNMFYAWTPPRGHKGTRRLLAYCSI